MARIRIGSFNVKNLSSKSGRNLTRIAQIINDYKLDIVALQEVLEGGRVIYSAITKELSGAAKGYNDFLINHLSGQWDSVWLQPSVRGKNLKYLSPDQRGEGYALLWRKDKFEIPPPVKDSKTGIEEDQGPIIFSDYHAAKDGLRLIRDPLYARLILKEKKAVELRILITHVIYGKPSISFDQDDFELDAGAIEMRKKEFHTLAGKIYNRLSKDYNVPECTAPYTLLMGDYNLNLKNSSASGAYVPSSSYEQGLAVAFYFLEVAKCGLFLFLSIRPDIELVTGFDGLILLNQVYEGTDQIDILMNRLAYIEEVIYKTDHPVQGRLIVRSHYGVKC